jgi:hypothetical protein
LKKILIFFILALSISITGCSNSSDYLTGKTFNLAYPPDPTSNQDILENHEIFMTLSFKNGTVTREDGNEIQGEYTLNDDILTIEFEKEKETLNVEFGELTESEKDFVVFVTDVSNVTLDGDSSEIKYLSEVGNKLNEGLPIEFIEE